MAAELGQRGLTVRSQVPLPVVYEGIRVELGFRLDLLVAERIIVEVKSVEDLADVPFKQLLTFLRLSDKQLGILVNFNAAVLKGSIRRVVNRLEEWQENSVSRKDAKAQRGRIRRTVFRLEVWAYG